MSDEAKARFDASAARNHDALQALIDRHVTTTPDLAAQLAQAKADLAAAQTERDAAKADYDALLLSMADYLDASTAQIEAAEGVTATAAA